MKQKWLDGLAAALAFRGRDGDGWPLRVWLLVVAASWPLALGWASVEPLWVVLPPFLTLAVALPCLGAIAREARRPGPVAVWLRRSEAFVACGVFAVLSWSMWRHLFSAGVFTDNLDHHIMIARAEEFCVRLGRGEWPRYSHYAEGGDSLSDMYPFALNFVAGFFWLLFQKKIVFETAWTMGVVSLWWLRGVASYALARRFAGPVVSLLLGLLSLFEVGEDVWDGVWSATIHFGMVHNNFAISLGMLATAYQLDLLRRLNRGTVIKAALFIVMACVAHPLGVIWTGLSTACVAAATAWGRGRVVRGLRALAVSGSALAVAAVFVLPFSFLMARYGFFQPVGGGSYDDLGASLISGKLPQSSYPALFALAAVASLAAIASRQPLGSAVGFLSLAFWLLALTPFLIQMGFYRFVPGFLDGQQRRMLTLLKTAMVPVGAWFAAFLLARLPRTGSLRPGRVFLRAALLSVLVLGLGRGLVQGFTKIASTLHAQVVMPAKGTKGPHRSNSNPNVEAAIDWLAKARLADRNPTLWRVALHYPYHEPTHARVWGASWRMGVPVVDFFWMSAVFLGNRPREASLQGYRDWNIRYALTIQNTPLPFPAEAAELRFTSGDYRIYEVKSFDPSFVTAPPGVAISDVAVRGDEISFSVAGAPAAGADVTVRVGYLPRWAASLDGRSLEVGPVSPNPTAIERQDQVRIHAGNGRVVLRADGTLPRAWPGRLMALVGLAGLVLLASPARLRAEAWALDRWGRALAWAASLWQSRRPALLAGLAVLLSASSAFSAIRGRKIVVAPAIEGHGLGVSFPGASCAPQPWLGAIRCSENGGTVAEVRAALGVDPNRDGTGEFPLLWPGTHVVTQRAGKIILQVQRFRVSSGALSFKFSTSGRWKVSAKLDATPLGSATAEGRGRFQIPVPPGATGAGTLTLELESSINNASITLAGGN